jgi:hypothetical protein
MVIICGIVVFVGYRSFSKAQPFGRAFLFYEIACVALKHVVAIKALQFLVN